MLIFNEIEHAKFLLDGGKKNKQLTFYELSLVAIYLRDVIGKSKDQVYDDLVLFCKENNADFNEILGRRRLKAALNKSDHYGIRKIKSKTVTKSEVETIRDTFSDYKKQRVLFAMIVLAKYFHDKSHHIKHRSTKYDDKYYVNQSLTRIFKIAGVHATRKERHKILYDLEQSGLIQTTLKGTFEILFIDEDSPTDIIVDDFYRINEFAPCFCVKCGKRYEWNSYSKNQLCDECYNKKRLEDVRKNMAKMRSK